MVAGAGFAAAAEAAARRTGNVADLDEGEGRDERAGEGHLRRGRGAVCR